MASRSWKGALLISGEPGTGKSRWIREESAAAKAKLFRWNARVDRSLREGREILHQQVRSKERMFVWIEGADDLTQEAQAFLRRILETAAPNVTCALEVRELWKLSPPILSRCTVIPMRSEFSYREQRNQSIARHLNLNINPPPLQNLPAWSEISALRRQGEDPYRILQLLIQTLGAGRNKKLQECIRAIGTGSSPWLQITNILFILSQTSASKSSV
jgi:DNA polymerase III delta prime subunit